MLNVHAIFTLNYLLEVNLDHPNNIFIGPIPSLLSRQNSSEICWKYTSKDTYTANNVFFCSIYWASIMDLFILNTSRNYYFILWIVLNSFINIYLKYTTTQTSNTLPLSDKRPATYNIPRNYDMNTHITIQTYTVLDWQFMFLFPFWLTSNVHQDPV